MNWNLRAGIEGDKQIFLRKWGRRGPPEWISPEGGRSGSILCTCVHLLTKIFSLRPRTQKYLLSRCLCH